MSCDCNNDRVELLIKQGEQRSYIFNITNSDGTPLDLSSREILVEIKKYPLYKVKALIEITLTNVDQGNGYINDPTNGQFTLTLTENESSLNPAEYYLIITMISGSERIIISGEGDLSGVLKVCRQ